MGSGASDRIDGVGSGVSEVCGVGVAATESGDVVHCRRGVVGGGRLRLAFRAAWSTVEFTFYGVLAATGFVVIVELLGRFFDGF